MPVPGESWNQFTLIEPLGKGGMGRVFLAQDGALDRKVALKFLPEPLEADQNARARFLKEARAAAALDHPYICKIYEVGEVDGRAYIAMEYVEGDTLRQTIASGPLPLLRVLDLGIELADALAAAHKKGVVHRDIKTLNVIVAPEGHVKVLDFGVARMVAMESLADSQVDTYSGQMSSSSTTSGTVIYMSPEQVRGEVVDGRTDVFSLGVVLYEMVTGEIPFQGATTGLIYDAILNLGPRPPTFHNPEVPAELERIILKALEKDRESRYQSAKDLMVDLKRMRRDTDTSIRTGEFAAVAETPPSKKGPGMWLAAAGVLLLTALAFLAPWSSTPSATIDSLAVLPFENVQNDPEIEYLGDGIAETLINRLSPLPTLKVKARSTTFRFRGAGIDPQTVGRDLGVGAVLTGRVVHHGDTLNVQAELVDASTGEQLWGEQYQRGFEDIFAVQNEIAHEISQALRLELTGEEEKLLAMSATSDSRAYRAYWRGRYHWNRRTNDAFKTAIALFEEAKATDPDFALAYVGLADSYVLLGAQFYGADTEYSPGDAMSRARTAARDAVALDPNLVEAQTTLAYIAFLHDWNWHEAEKRFQQAIELDARYAVAHQWYAELLMVLGRHDEAIGEAQLALEIEPGSPILSRELAFKYLQARRYDEAIEQLRQTLAIDPAFSATRRMLVDAYWYSGKTDELLAELDGIDARFAPFYRHLVGGDLEAAVAVLDALPADEFSASGLAGYYALAGDKERTLDRLEEAYRLRQPGLPLTLRRPALDRWRSEPRLVDLRRNLGLEV